MEELVDFNVLDSMFGYLRRIEFKFNTFKENTTKSWCPVKKSDFK